MIPHRRFHSLRFSDFAPRSRIIPLKGWEYLDRYWVGEAIGFSAFLRLEDDPDKTRCISVDFAMLPKKIREAIFAKLDLSLEKGQDLKSLVDLFGKPKQRLVFVEDRTTYEFVHKAPDPYGISCTVLKNGGLVFCDVVAKL
jgi:hypothetical protein